MSTWKECLVLIVAVVTMGAHQRCLAEGFEAGILTNASTNMLEPRVGVVITENWTAGLLGLYYEPDLEGDDWGCGIFAKMAVDPNASIALKEWLPAIGDVLGLPETIEASTYGIGRFVYTQADGESNFAASIGAGAQVAIVCLECEYGIVDGGATDNPVAVSGLEVKFGLMIPF